jgi:hypothetical protein
LCLFSLPLCGAPGLTPAPALILWLLYVGFGRVRAVEPGARRSGVILLSSALATMALIAFYFHDFKNPRQQFYSHDPLDALRSGLMFLSLSFGPAAREYWPSSGWLTAAVLLPTLAMLAMVFKSRPHERYRVAGLLAIGVGVVSMALATGIARGSGVGTPLFANRYVTLPAPILCCVYLAFCLYGPAALGRIVRISLYSILLAMVFYNVRVGSSYGHRRAELTAAFCKELQEGVPLDELALRHWRGFYNEPTGFFDRLKLLRKYNFEPLASARVEEADLSRVGKLGVSSPVRISSPRAFQGLLDDEYVLLVPPDCEVQYSLRKSDKTVTGRFGIHPLGIASAPPGGLRFEVQLMLAEGTKRTLFDRVLLPTDRPEDRGHQELSVVLPGDRGGMLVLRTSLADGTGSERVVAYWKDVEIR